MEGDLKIYGVKKDDGEMYQSKIMPKLLNGILITEKPCTIDESQFYEDSALPETTKFRSIDHMLINSLNQNFYGKECNI